MSPTAVRSGRNNDENGRKTLRSAVPAWRGTRPCVEGNLLWSGQVNELVLGIMRIQTGILGREKLLRRASHSFRVAITKSRAGGSPYNGTNEIILRLRMENGINKEWPTSNHPWTTGRVRKDWGQPGLIQRQYHPLFQSLRIPPIEYLYFNAKYNSVIRYRKIWSWDNG